MTVETGSLRKGTRRRRLYFSQGTSVPLLLLCSRLISMSTTLTCDAASRPSSFSCQEDFPARLPSIGQLTALGGCGVSRFGIVHLSARASSPLSPPATSSFTHSFPSPSPSPSSSPGASSTPLPSPSFSPSCSPAWTSLPPGLHLFFEFSPSLKHASIASTAASSSFTSLSFVQNASVLPLLSLLTAEQKTSSSLPFFQQCARVPTALQRTLRGNILMWEGSEVENEKKNQEVEDLLWYHVAEAVDLEEDRLLPLLIRSAPQREEEEDPEGDADPGTASILGYLLTASLLSSNHPPSPAFATDPSSASLPVQARVLRSSSSSDSSSSSPPPPGISLSITAPGPPGLHREIRYSYSNLPLRTSSSLLVVFHLPQGAYVDTYELSERHTVVLEPPFSPSSPLSPSSSPPCSLPSLLTAAGPLDVELPYSHSAQHCIAFLLPCPSLVPSSSLVLSLPLHLRYPLPSLNVTHPFVSLSPPIPSLWTRPVHQLDRDDWQPLPPPFLLGPALSLRVPAGEAWRREYVGWVTLVAEATGALLLLVVGMAGSARREGKRMGGGKRQRDEGSEPAGKKRD